MDMTLLDQAVTIIQRMLKLVSISGKTKHSRYLRTALENLRLYKRLTEGKDKEE
jgi:hypothetical protein